MVDTTCICIFFQTDLCNPACMNGGTCVEPNTCICTPGFTGTNCADGSIFIYLLIFNLLNSYVMQKK